MLNELPTHIMYSEIIVIRNELLISFGQCPYYIYNIHASDRMYPIEIRILV